MKIFDSKIEEILHNNPMYVYASGETTDEEAFQMVIEAKNKIKSLISETIEKSKPRISDSPVGEIVINNYHDNLRKEFGLDE